LSRIKRAIISDVVSAVAFSIPSGTSPRTINRSTLLPYRNLARRWAKDEAPKPPALDPVTGIFSGSGNSALATSMPALTLQSPRWRRTFTPGANQSGSITSLSPLKTDP
jgi:hypothetical protein